MKELTPEELKEVQLHIMDYVDRFCRENDINYSLACGTLLGAIRHGGFIPWDDDIDIHLLRNEYRRFTKIWNEKKDSHPFEMISIESGNNMGFPFAKIHDPRTVTYWGNMERTGVFIDVFPIDYVIDEDDYRLRQAQISQLYKKRISCFRWMAAQTPGTPFYKKILAFICKPKISYNEIAIKISNIAQEVEGPTDFVYEMVGAVTLKRPVPATAYKDYIDHKFEDRSYRIISGYEEYLSTMYGDWHTPPPLEKQVIRHGKAYWK